MTRQVAAMIGIVGAAAIAMTAPVSVGLAQNVQIPIFEYDPTFPGPLPENWAIGAIGGLAVDRQDHLYVVQRPGTLRSNERFTGSGDTPPKADCCIPAPPVLEFDQAGKLIHSWGGPGAGYDWPQTEHGVFVDQKDTVWLAGSGENDAQLLKFTREGKFLQQFGKPGTRGGSSDTATGNEPTRQAIPFPFGFQLQQLTTTRRSRRRHAPGFHGRSAVASRPPARRNPPPLGNRPLSTSTAELRRRGGSSSIFTAARLSGRTAATSPRGLSADDAAGAGHRDSGFLASPSVSRVYD